MNITEKLCLERDCNRCRHCSATEDLNAFCLTKFKSTAKLPNLITLCDSCQAESISAGKLDNNKVGVILCGGIGSRLFPMTKFINKHHLPIGILPTIFYPLKTMRSLGVRRILMVVGRDDRATMDMLGSGKEFGLDISYKVQEGADGISGALYLAKDFARLGDEIVCILGDNIFDPDSVSPDVSLSEGSSACVWLKQVDDPRAYGVAEVKDGRVLSIVEKPENPASDLAVVGLYMYDYSVFDIIDSIEPSERGELEISSVNDEYAKLGKLKYEMVTGYWGDSGGSIQRYAECSMHGVRQCRVSEEEVKEFVSTVFDDK